MPRCNNLCARFERTSKGKGNKIYIDNVKLCRTCSKFMYLDTMRCPCCNQKVINKSRRYKSKE